MAICLIFGITGSICSMFLRFGLCIFIRALARDPKSSIRMLSNDEISTFQSAISQKHSMLSDVYAVADGLKLYFEQKSNSMIQNSF